VYQSSQVYKDRTNSVPSVQIVKNSQKQSKQQKGTLCSTQSPPNT